MWDARGRSPKSVANKVSGNRSAASRDARANAPRINHHSPDPPEPCTAHKLGLEHGAESDILDEDTDLDVSSLPRSVKFAEVTNTQTPSTTTHLAWRLAKTPFSGTKP